MANTRTRKKRIRAIVASLPRRECLWCGKEFRLIATVSGSDTHVMCGPECASASLRAREAGDWERAQQRASRHRSMEWDARMANARSAKGNQRGEEVEEEQEVQEVEEQQEVRQAKGRRKGKAGRNLRAPRRPMEAEDQEGRPHVLRPRKRRRSPRLARRNRVRGSEE